MNISPKVTTATLAAAAVTVLAWGARLAGLELPAEVQGALTTILVGVAGYLTTDPARHAGH